MIKLVTIVSNSNSSSSSSSTSTSHSSSSSSLSAFQHSGLAVGPPRGGFGEQDNPGAERTVF